MCGIGHPDCDAAFLQLKERLVTSPILGYPVFNQPFMVDPMLVGEGLGVVLSQYVSGLYDAIGYLAAMLDSGMNLLEEQRQDFSIGQVIQWMENDSIPRVFPKHLSSHTQALWAQSSYLEASTCKTTCTPAALTLQYGRSDAMWRWILWGPYLETSRGNKHHLLENRSQPPQPPASPELPQPGEQLRSFNSEQTILHIEQFNLQEATLTQMMPVTLTCLVLPLLLETKSEYQSARTLARKLRKGYTTAQREVTGARVTNVISPELRASSTTNSKELTPENGREGAAARITEQRKHCSNDAKCDELAWVCVPLVVESYGAWEKKDLESISQLASCLATCSSKAKSVVLTELYGRLNLHLVRCSACHSVKVEAAVAESLPVEVILGTDASSTNRAARKTSWFLVQEDAMVVTTRAKRRQELLEEIVRKGKGAEKLKDLQEQDETLAVGGHLHKRQVVLEESSSKEISCCTEDGYQKEEEKDGEPFSRIAMDIVGPLPRSRAGNKYILVLCDYATRYPEAVPPKSIDAESVAEELIKKLLQMHPIRTSPYHPQTDGLVERSNQTLKSMLRKSGTDGGKVGQEDSLPTFCVSGSPASINGIFPFRAIAQLRQKSWFDKDARLREFKPGDTVLVLLPTSSDKLLAQWQGPYQVLQRVELNLPAVNGHPLDSGMKKSDPGIYKGSAANRFRYSFWDLSVQCDAIWLSGAPATFQRLMDRLLRGSADPIGDAGLTVKLSKSKFAAKR
eukprot:Em0431g1a